MQPQIEEVPVVSADGARSRALAAPAVGEPRGAVVCFPAMGVAAGYYEPLARALAARGFDVLVAELRGTGTSAVRPSRKVDFGYADMIAHDLPSAIAEARRRFVGRPLHVLGHSLGGQLAALLLAERPDAFERLVLIAASSVDYRGYPMPARLRVLFGTQTARVVAHGLGYFPGDRLGFGGRQPVGVIDDWGRQALTGQYRLRGGRIDHEAGLRRVTSPVLAVSLEGDTLSPASAVDRLCAKMPGAELVRRHIAPAWATRKGDPHFRWVREPGAVVEEVAGFLAAPA